MAPSATATAMSTNTRPGSWRARDLRSPANSSASCAVSVDLSATSASSTADPPAAVDPPSSPSAAPTTGPIVLYTLEKSEHRNPVPIVWHAESHTFFVGTFHDGSIYRGRPDDPSVWVFLEGQPGQAASGIGLGAGRLLVAGGIYGDIRAYDLQTRERVAEFTTGSDGFLMGMHVTEAGEVWVTDALRPMLWHLTAEQVAAGSGTPVAVPLTPEIPHVSSPDNVEASSR